MSSKTRSTLSKISARIMKLAVKGKDQISEYHKLVDEFIERGDFDNYTQTLYYYFSIDVTKYNGNILDIKNKTWPDILFQTNTPLQKKIKKIYDDRQVFQQGFDVYSDSVVTIGLTISQPLSSTFSVTSSTQSVTPSRTGNYIYFTTNDPEIYRMELFKCEWITTNGVEQPFAKTLQLFQRFKMFATQSAYLTEISIYHGRQYLVRTFSRNSNIQFTELNYKLSVTRNTLLGQIIEVDSYEQDPAYYYRDPVLAVGSGDRKTFLEVRKTGTSSIYVTYQNPLWNEQQNLLKRYEVAVDYLIS